MSIVLYVLPIVSLVTALAVTPLAAHLARSVGAVDVPGGRKRHASATPKFGGLAIFVAVAAALGLTPWLDADAAGLLAVMAGPSWQWTACGGFLVLLLGLVDDVRSLGAFPKLAIQVMAGLLAAAGGCIVNAVTNPFGGGHIYLFWMSVPLTVVWIVLVMNAINLIDGLDGLAAGAAVIICATIYVLARIDSRPDAAFLAAVLGAAALGFLVHNRHPAKIFLGDSGSLFLGYALAVLSMQGLQKGPTATLLVAPMLALGIPLLDTAATVMRRATATGLGSIMQADHAHLHHRLLDLGLPHRSAVYILYAACAAFGLTAIAVRNLHGVGQGVLVAAVTLAVYFAARKLRRPAIRQATSHDRD